MAAGAGPERHGVVGAAVRAGAREARAGAGAEGGGDRVRHARNGRLLLSSLAGQSVRFRFRLVGTIENVGFKFDRWIDVGYWERILDV